MDTAFHLVCYLGGTYEIIRTVAIGTGTDRHSDAKAVSRTTVLKTRDYKKASDVIRLLREADQDSSDKE
jgi:hypothetical protein